MFSQGSWRRTGWRPLENHSAVEIVDLTGPDNEEVIPERWAARDAAGKCACCYVFFLCFCSI